ncbi:MAG: T9SS type A sorting domain-containing protein [Bacteroidetes bacterium]|nr:T9SS type A sorting domain-containing protein [Bacteroidota bacterium]
MKKITILFLLSVLIGGLSGFAQIPTNGLIGKWSFTGNANDESGNNYNGTVTGATLTTDRFGNSNSAYSFNGTSNFISVTGLNCTNDWSISFWYLSNSTNAFDMQYLFGNGVGTNYGRGIGISGGGNAQITGKKLISYDGNAITGNWAMGPSYTNAIWYHVVVVDSANYHRVYFDNVMYPKVLLNNIDLTNLTIGKRSDNVWFFNGKIDDIRTYDRVLTPTEVTALYNEGICFTSITVTDTLIINANLTGYYPITYQNTIKIYPNPTNDHITIDFGSNYSTLNGYTLKITNSLSQIVYTTPITQLQTIVDLSTWTGNGIYFVHLIDAQSNTIDIRKIVLQ